ncbi:hypothetical protein [Flavobacterium sp.]|uniref:hypothetical protein n=1 Tax=Flavobacterium sp. TaxID=239 RepID=UPI0039E28E01
MDAFGYKTLENGTTEFIWIVEDLGEIVALNGPLGQYRDSFYVIGPQSEALYHEAIRIARQNGFVFDFNDKCGQLLLRFPLSQVSDVGHFRFEVIEPVLNTALQQSGNGFCDYGFCDEAFFNEMPFVYDPEIAVQTIVDTLKQHEVDIENLAVFSVRNGAAEKQWWP